MNGINGMISVRILLYTKQLYWSFGEGLFKCCVFCVGRNKIFSASFRWVIISLSVLSYVLLSHRELPTKRTEGNFHTSSSVDGVFLPDYVVTVRCVRTTPVFTRKGSRAFACVGTRIVMPCRVYYSLMAIPITYLLRFVSSNPLHHSIHKGRKCSASSHSHAH